MLALNAGPPARFVALLLATAVAGGCATSEAEPTPASHLEGNVRAYGDGFSFGGWVEKADGFCARHGKNGAVARITKPVFVVGPHGVTERQVVSLEIRIDDATSETTPTSKFRMEADLIAPPVFATDTTQRRTFVLDPTNGIGSGTASFGRTAPYFLVSVGGRTTEGPGAVLINAWLECKP
ncbi:MAG TPA: hypothetical protein VHM30_01355 [Gemmatimonadaceae bacterium]|nr:hypothetical protein [Gemmatimonadaceae bacterium]